MVVNRFRRIIIIFYVALRLWISYTAFKYLNIFTNLNTKSERLKRLHIKNANLLLKKCTQLKGAVIKIVQLLATRPDFIPQEYCDILSNLHDSLSPFSYQKIKKTFLQEFEKEPYEIFDEFDEIAFAAASLGQVHKAKKDNQHFAVKIQYPNIDKIVVNDMKNLDLAVKLFAQKIYSSYAVAAPIYEEIKKHILDEGWDFKNG